MQNSTKRLNKRHTSLFSGICREIRTNFIKHSQKKLQNSTEKMKNIGNSIFIREKMLAIFGWNFEFEERCKGVHCVDLGESFPTSIYLQKSASIQPRTSPSKFGGNYSILFNRVLKPQRTAANARDHRAPRDAVPISKIARWRLLQWPILQLEVLAKRAKKIRFCFLWRTERLGVALPSRSVVTKLRILILRCIKI